MSAMTVLQESPASTAQFRAPTECDGDYTTKARTFVPGAAHMSFVQATITTDTECRNILHRHLAGDFPDGLTRQLIAAELHRSGIAAEVAGEKTVQSSQMLRDLTSDMQSLLFQKVIQTTPGGFDPKLGASNSTTAWARQLLRAARASIIRNMMARTIQKMDLVDPQPQLAHQSPEDMPQPTSYTIFHSAIAEDQGHGQRGQNMEDAADWLRSKTRHLRDNSKLAAQAATIMHGYGVPALVRPRVEERRRLKALIDADESLAHRSIRYVRAVIERDAVTGDVDPGLQALWDDYTAEHLTAIAEARPKVALALVDNALSDRARPSRDVRRSFRASVRALGTGRGWARLAEETCEAFIALEFEAYSAFDSAGAGFRDERIAGRIIACQKAPEVFARALSHPGQRLGKDEDALYEQLDRLIRSLTDLEVKAPELP